MQVVHHRRRGHLQRERPGEIARRRILSHRREDAEVAIDDVLRMPGMDRLVVAPARPPLAQEGRREPNAARGAAQPRRGGRLRQSLQVEREIVGTAPQVVPEREPGGNGRAAARGEDDQTVDHRDEVEQLGVALVDRPVDRRFREPVAERRGDRQGVHDVADRAEADDQQPHGGWVTPRRPLRLGRPRRPLPRGSGRAGRASNDPSGRPQSPSGRRPP